MDNLDAHARFVKPCDIVLPETEKVLLIELDRHLNNLKEDEKGSRGFPPTYPELAVSPASLDGRQTMHVSGVWQKVDLAEEGEG